MRLLIALAICFCCIHVGATTKPDKALTDFIHSVWTEKDGVPPNTFAIAQTEDGWMFFGGPNGLYQFDGMRFQEVRREAAANQRLSVSVMFALPSGELVIGLVGGGISIYNQGKFTDYDDSATVSAGRVQNFARDHDGTVWATCDHALLRFDGTKWQAVGEEWAYPTEGAFGLAVDGRGTLWVATATRVLFLPKGSRSFLTMGASLEGGANFIQSHDGMTWLLRAGSAELLPGQEAGKRDPAATSRMSDQEVIDSDGYLWSYFPARAGFPYPSIGGIKEVARYAVRWTTGLEDRQRNIWFASNAGEIHRFRKPLLTKVSSPEIMDANHPRFTVAAFVPDETGSVWIAMDWLRTGGIPLRSTGAWMFDTALRRVQPESLSTVGEITRARDGTIWYASEQNLWRLKGDRFERALALPEVWGSEPAMGLAVGCAGGVWIANPRMGLWGHDGSGWRRNGGIGRLPDEAPTRQVCDTSDRLWLGYSSGTLLLVDGSNVKAMNAAQGLRLGRITDISVGKHVLVAGDQGLAVMIAGHFSTLKAANRSAFEGITGLAQTSDGDVWLNGASSVGHLRAGDLPQSAEAADNPVPVNIYDVSDGYPGPGHARPHAPSIAIDAKGRVWVSGFLGIAYLDASVARKTLPAPPALIRSVRTNAEIHEPARVLMLPQGSRNLHIDYTALNYTHPERIRFRYQLEGLETAWTEDDGRRQAAYRNMGPGTYRFLVDASDERGAWGNRPAVMDITIAPTFLESWYFKALCALGLLGLALSTHRWRLHQVASRQRRLLEERLYERERIARELHDTLLQGTQALILKIHIVADQLPPSGQLRDRLDGALKVAQGSINEARDRIQMLREEPDASKDLAAALVASGSELVHGTDVAFHLHVEGNARPIQTAVAEAAHLIAQEAMRNALQHAKAKAIELQIVYAADRLRVQVRDDGRGMDQSTLSGAATRGHWGLKGMRERALEVGGELTIWSRKGAGTEIELRVPAAAAFEHVPNKSWWHWLPGSRR